MQYHHQKDCCGVNWISHVSQQAAQSPPEQGALPRGAGKGAQLLVVRVHVAWGQLSHAEELMIRGSSLLAAPRHRRYVGLLEELILNMSFRILLGSSDRVHFKAPSHLSVAVPPCFSPSLSLLRTPKSFRFCRVAFVS